MTKSVGALCHLSLVLSLPDTYGSHSAGLSARMRKESHSTCILQPILLLRRPDRAEKNVPQRHKPGTGRHDFREMYRLAESKRPSLKHDCDLKSLDV